MPPKKGQPLTDQQSRVFEFIKGYIMENGYAPLYREIQAGAGLSNVGLVHKNISALERKGYIHKKENTKRGLELTKVGEETRIHAIPGQLTLFEHQTST